MREVSSFLRLRFAFFLRFFFYLLVSPSFWGTAGVGAFLSCTGAAVPATFVISYLMFSEFTNILVVVS